MYISVFGCCIAILPQTQPLMTAQIYCVTVPRGQESGHNLAGSSASRSCRSSFKVLGGLQSDLKLEGGRMFSIQFLTSCLRSQGSCCLAAGGCSRFLSTWVSQPGFLATNKGERDCPLRTGITITHMEPFYRLEPSHCPIYTQWEIRNKGMDISM